MKGTIKILSYKSSVIQVEIGVSATMAWHGICDFTSKAERYVQVVEQHMCPFSQSFFSVQYKSAYPI